MTRRERLTRAFPPSPGAVRRARHLVARACRRWGLDGLCADAQTVASELVTNAVRHAGTRLELAVEPVGDGLRIEVRDGSRQPAEPHPPGLFGEGGRGLLLVTALTTSWATEPEAGGKRVSAELHPPRGY